MLRQFIRNSGLTQTQWAERFGVTSSYLSVLLQGGRKPSLQLAVRIERETDGAVPATSWVAPCAAPAAPVRTPEGSEQ
jgi:transcriptional regulator with XRE-family HTH domain